MSKTHRFTAIAAAFAASLGFAGLAAAMPTDRTPTVDQSKPKGSGDGELRPSVPAPLPGADDDDKPKGSRGG